jgi:hypothetical protein
MTPEQMLRNLSEHGEDAASDYNDALDGWFGWQVTGDLITVTFQADEDPGRKPGTAGTFVASWRLVPVEAGGQDR